MRSTRPRAAIFGCAGHALTADEKAFFRDADPLGFILFARNCVDPTQIRDLTESLRASIRRPDAPIALRIVCLLVGSLVVAQLATMALTLLLMAAGFSAWAQSSDPAAPPVAEAASAAAPARRRRM